MSELRCNQPAEALHAGLNLLGRDVPEGDAHAVFPLAAFVGEEALARLRKIHPCYGAPVVLVVGCRNEEAWVRESDGVIAAKTDAAIVLTHMMLTATDAGLANMWIWDFDPAKIREAFPEIREHGVYGLLAIGHPAAGQGKPTELHDQRKPIEDLVKEL